MDPPADEIWMVKCQLWNSLCTLAFYLLGGPAAILQGGVTDYIIVAVSEPRLHLADAVAHS